MNMLEKIWVIADRFGNPLGYFGPCGLFLQRPLKRWEYFCTPHNSLTFATTGGDGVHYGFLMINQLEFDYKPIVMTVPMSDPYNVIIAENFEEFLGLGYYMGWFALEQIIYKNSMDAVSYFAGPDTEESPERDELLVILRKEFNIKHIPLSLARLDELKKKYEKLIEADDEP